MKKSEFLKQEIQKSRGLRLSEGTAKKPLIVDIPLEAIEAKEQVRFSIEEESEELQELAQSMKEMGLLQPILVYPTKEGKFVIIAGHRRAAAARLLGWKTIRAIVKNPPLEEEKQVLQLIENLQRKDLSPIEEAVAYKRLYDMGMTHEEIAKKVGKDRARITHSLKIIDLILKMCGAAHFSELTPDLLSKALRELGGLSRAALEELAAAVDKPYFEDLLREAKKGATSKKLRDLKKLWDAKARFLGGERRTQIYKTSWGTVSFPVSRGKDIGEDLQRVEEIVNTAWQMLEGILSQKGLKAKVKIEISEKNEKEK